MPYLIHNAIALELLENSSNTFIHFLLGPLKIPFKFFFFLLLKYFLKFYNCIEWVACWTFFLGNQITLKEFIQPLGSGIGCLHDDVVLRRRPESLGLLLFYANWGFCNWNLAGMTIFKYERKNEKDSGCSIKMMAYSVQTLKIGTLSKATTTAVKTSIKKWICVLSNLIASIWTCSICQMQATFHGVEFLRILFRFKKRKENSSSYVHFLHNTSN